MKGKKYKRSQRFVHSLYEKYFGIRKAYQVLVDAPFCIDSMKGKIAPVEALTEVFGGPVKLMTTPCIQAELKKYDRANDTGAYFISRRFEVRRCRHENNPKSGSDCLRDLISTDNPHHYSVATQDSELRKSLRNVPGVPIILILRDTVVMEPPSEKSLLVARNMEKKKRINPIKKDMEVIKKVVTEKIGTSDFDDKNGTALHKSKKNQKKMVKNIGKSPNPLSCKKSTKKTKAAPHSSETTTKSADTTTTTASAKVTKKPRKRRAKKAKSEPKKRD